MIKKTMTIVMILVLVMSLAACGKKTESITATKEENGVETSMKFDAKNDKVTAITQMSKVDTSTLDDATKGLIENSSTQLEAITKDISGITYSTKYEGDIFVETFEYDLTKADLEELISNKLLDMESGADFISLKQTEDNLSSSGWTITK